MHEVVMENIAIMASDRDHNAWINSSRPTCELAISYPAAGTGTAASAKLAVRPGAGPPNIAASFAAAVAADPA